VRVWDVKRGLFRSLEVGDTGSVERLGFSPDGSLLAAGIWDGIGFWDVKSGKLKAAPRGLTAALGFSPDGSLLGSDKDGNFQLWDVKTGKLETTLKGTGGIIAFSPDGSLLASDSNPKWMQLWDVKSGKVVATLADAGTVFSLTFSRDGTLIASGSQEGIVRLWAIPTNPETATATASAQANSPTTTPVRGSLPPTATPIVDPAGQVDRISDVTFAPDDKSILTSNGNSTEAKQWDVQTGALLRVFSGHTSGLTSVAISRDGKIVATGSYDDTVRLWDASSGQVLQTIDLYWGFDAGRTLPRSVALAPDGKTVAAGNNFDGVQVWDVETGRRLPAYMLILGKPVKSLVYSPNGQTIAIALDSPDNMADLLAAPTGDVLLSFVGHTDKVSSVAFSPDGLFLLTGSWDGTARLWNVATGRLLRTFAPIAHNGLHVLSVAFSPDGKTVLTGSADNTARVWSVATGQLVYSVASQFGDVASVAFSNDGKCIAIAEGTTVRIMDAAAGQPLHTIPTNGS